MNSFSFRIRNKVVSMEYEVYIKEVSVVVNLNGDIDIFCSDYVRRILLVTVVKTPLTFVYLLDG